MWEAFRKSPRGRTILPNELTIPNRIFLSILKRDYLVHHMLQQFPLQRIFLEKDPVEAIPHWTRSMDDLLETSGHVEQVKPRGLEYVDARIQALWIAADICGICEFSYEACPLRLIHLIQDRRTNSTDKYTFAVRIDAVLRKAINNNYLSGSRPQQSCRQY